jgi:hypothetical protein
MNWLDLCWFSHDLWLHKKKSRKLTRKQLMFKYVCATLSVSALFCDIQRHCLKIWKYILSGENNIDKPYYPWCRMVVLVLKSLSDLKKDMLHGFLNLVQKVKWNDYFHKDSIPFQFSPRMRRGSFWSAPPTSSTRSRKAHLFPSPWLRRLWHLGKAKMKVQNI